MATTDLLLIAHRGPRRSDPVSGEPHARAHGPVYPFVQHKSQSGEVGSSENTNGPRRQYLSKGIDPLAVTASELRAIQRSLGERPRKTPGNMTRTEKSTELVAASG